MYGHFDKKSRHVPDQPGDVAGYIYAFTPDERDSHYSVIDIAGVLDAEGNVIRSTRPGILVSTRTSDQIMAAEKERQRKQKEQEEREDAERLAELGRDFDQELNKPARISPFSAAGSAARALKRHGVELPDLDKDQAALKPPQPDTDYDPLKAMPVYAPDEPIKMLRTTLSTTPDKERLEARVALYNEIKPKGSVRKLGAPANIEALQQLERGFPHFKRVLKLIHNQIKLAERTKRTLKLPPMLLLGEAGVGKTEFTHQLARLFGSPVKRLPFDNDEVPSSLLGSAKHWSNSTAGAVFEALVKGTHANPILLLDEIDKAHRNSYRGDPLASLHTLLETSRSTSLRQVGAWITPRSSIPMGSVAQRLRSSGISAADTDEIAQDIWFDNWEKGLDLWELARHYAGTDTTTSLLWFDSEDLPEVEVSRFGVRVEDDGGLAELTGQLTWPSRSRRR